MCMQKTEMLPHTVINWPRTNKCVKLTLIPKSNRFGTVVSSSLMMKVGAWGKDQMSEPGFVGTGGSQSNLVGMGSSDSVT